MLEFEPIEPTDTERIWEFDADLDGNVWTYQIKWVERTGAHYLTLWNAAGELVLAGRRLGPDMIVNLRFLGRAGFPTTLLILVDLDDSQEPVQYEELGHRLRFMTYTQEELPSLEQPTYDVQVV